MVTIATGGSGLHGNDGLRGYRARQGAVEHMCPLMLGAQCRGESVTRGYSTAAAALATIVMETSWDTVESAGLGRRGGMADDDRQEGLLLLCLMLLLLLLMVVVLLCCGYTCTCIWERTVCLVGKEEAGSLGKFSELSGTKA